MRENLSDKAGDLRDKVSDKAGDIKDSLEDIDIKGKGEDLYASLSDKIDSLKDSFYHLFTQTEGVDLGVDKDEGKDLPKGERPDDFVDKAPTPEEFLRGERLHSGCIRRNRSLMTRLNDQIDAFKLFLSEKFGGDSISEKAGDLKDLAKEKIGEMHGKLNTEGAAAGNDARDRIKDSIHNAEEYIE